MKKFAMLATGAVVASTIVPVFALSDDNGAGNATQLVVDQSGVTMSSSAAFNFGTAAPGDEDVTSGAVGYSVLTNNAGGYRVNLDVSDITKTGVKALLDDGSASGNDRIDDADIWVVNNTVLTHAEAIADSGEAQVYNPGKTDAAADPAVPGFDATSAPKIAESGIRSRADADTFEMKLRFDMPWIETGSYAGTAVFTATNLE